MVYGFVNGWKPPSYTMEICSTQDSGLAMCHPFLVIFALSLLISCFFFLLCMLVLFVYTLCFFFPVKIPALKALTQNRQASSDKPLPVCSHYRKICFIWITHIVISKQGCISQAKFYIKRLLPVCFHFLSIATAKKCFPPEKQSEVTLDLIGDIVTNCLKFEARILLKWEQEVLSVNIQSRKNSTSFEERKVP